MVHLDGYVQRILKTLSTITTNLENIIDYLANYRLFKQKINYRLMVNIFDPGGRLVY